LLKTQQPLKARKKTSKGLKSLEFWNFFKIGLANFENNPILIYKIRHKFLLTTKGGEKSSFKVTAIVTTLYFLHNLQLG
jgi:hypothetical protein